LFFLPSFHILCDIHPLEVFFLLPFLLGPMTHLTPDCPHILPISISTSSSSHT
jgi:hypothetical protein